MTVLITRLLTGEEILGEVVDGTDPHVTRVKNPTLIAASPNPKSGNVDIHMAPYTPLSENKFIELRTSLILCQYAPVTEVVNKYNSMFGSGIILPTNSGIQTVS